MNEILSRLVALFAVVLCADLRGSAIGAPSETSESFNDHCGRHVAKDVTPNIDC